MGKSRLVAEFVRTARRAGLHVAFGECQAFGTTTAYSAMARGVEEPVRHRRRRRGWAADGVDDPERQLAIVEGALQRIDPGLVARAPLLEAVLGVTIPDNELTSAFDPKLRKASLEDLLARCLQSQVRAAGRDRAGGLPLDRRAVRDLLETLVRVSASAPVLFVLAYRPAASTGGGLGLERLPQFHEIALSRLDARGNRRADPLEAWAADRVRHRRTGGARLADRGSGRREPVLRRGIPQLPRRPGHRPDRCRSDPVARASQQPPEPHPEPDRSTGRGTATNPQGGERDRSGLSRSGAATASIRSSAHSTR